MNRTSNNLLKSLTSLVDSLIVSSRKFKSLVKIKEKVLPSTMKAKEWIQKIKEIQATKV